MVNVNTLEYKEGYQAFNDGYDKSYCPKDYSTEQCVNWLEGWIDAKYAEDTE